VNLLRKVHTLIGMTKREKYCFKFDNWSQFDISTFKELHSEIKERHGELISESETITKRGISIFTFLVVLSAFLVTSQKGVIGFDIPIFGLIVLLFVLSLILLREKDGVYRGTELPQLLTPELISPDEEKIQARIFYTQQLQMYQERIEKMRGHNVDRINLFRVCLLVILILIMGLFAKTIYLFLS